MSLLANGGFQERGGPRERDKEEEVLVYDAKKWNLKKGIIQYGQLFELLT